MLVGADQAASTEAEFGRLLDAMIADEAPRLFAVVEVYGERADGRIAAWGMAFDGHAEVVGVEGQTRASLSSPECATLVFGYAPDVTARVVWVNPEVAGPPDDNEGAAA